MYKKITFITWLLAVRKKKEAEGSLTPKEKRWLEDYSPAAGYMDKHDVWEEVPEIFEVSSDEE